MDPKKVIVRFEKGRGGDLVAKTDKVSFVDKRYKSVKLVEGEDWLVEIIGENPRKTVNFLRPLRKMRAQDSPVVLRVNYKKGAAVEIQYAQFSSRWAEWDNGHFLSEMYIINPFIYWPMETLDQLKSSLVSDVEWNKAKEARISFLEQEIPRWRNREENCSKAVEEVQAAQFKVEDKEEKLCLTIEEKSWVFRLKDGYVRVSGDWAEFTHQDASDSETVELFVPDSVGGIDYNALPIWARLEKSIKSSDFASAIEQRKVGVIKNLLKAAEEARERAGKLTQELKMLKSW